MRSRRHVIAALLPGLLLLPVALVLLALLAVTGTPVAVAAALGTGLLLAVPAGLLVGRLTAPVAGPAAEPTDPAAPGGPAEEPLVDPVTGAGTRRTLDRDLPGIVDTARRHGRPLTLLLVGLDGHGDLEINEGRERADEALRTAVAVLTEGRPGDRVYRLGGPEFAVVLPETGTAGAHVAAERMRVELAGRIAGVTASIGLTTLDLVTPDVDSLVARTGAGLDAARRRGGDLVVESSDLRRNQATGDATGA